MIELRRATENDLELMMAWRSSPDIYQGFYTQRRPLSWEEHTTWFSSRNQDWKTFIIEYEDRSVGVITIGQLDHWCPEIGYYIGETTLWGKGLGKVAVALSVQYIRDCGRDFAHTTILDTNERSIRLIKSLGFSILGPARSGESWYQRCLKEDYEGKRY